MTIDYKQIEAANATINPTPIRGKNGVKNYAQVNERIKAFRMVYPTGTIFTEMTSNEGGVCIFRAQVGYYDTEQDGDVVLGTGTAYEKENGSYINKTSYIENCETSAVGRALGMAGFGIDASLASAEEVMNAQNNQTVKSEAKSDEQILREAEEIKKAEAEMKRIFREMCPDEPDAYKKYLHKKLKDAGKPRGKLYDLGVENVRSMLNTMRGRVEAAREAGIIAPEESGAVDG